MSADHNTDDDPIPRDLIALVILHGLLSGNSPDDLTDKDVIGMFADVAYTFADAMISRGEQ
jgi:hypothetical protein